MQPSVTILLAEDDPGHARLVERNLRRSGVVNDVILFSDGQQIIDFLATNGDWRSPHQSYLLLLDIHMPKLDGTEVLRRVKADPELRRLPVIMLTTTDDPREIARCHDLGCSSYIVKPVDSQRFLESLQRLGLYLSIIEVPELAGRAS